MPTLEELEARLEALEQRILPVLRGERTPEFRELEARVNEQIRALQQQQAEQQRQMLVDRNATNALLNKTDQLQSDFKTLQTTINHMQQDLHLILEMFRAQQTQLAEVRQDLNSRFSTQDAKFDQVLQQLASITIKLD